MTVVNNFSMSINDEVKKINNNLDELFDIKQGYALDILEEKFNNNDLMYLPYFTVMMADSISEVDEVTKDIAVLSQLIFLSSAIHYRIPEKTESVESFRNRVQFPILIGDLLYSKFFEIVCSKQCTHYLDQYIDYISKNNQTCLDYLDGLVGVSEVVEDWHGELSKLIVTLICQEKGIKQELLQPLEEIGLYTGCVVGGCSLELGVEFQKSILNKLENSIEKIEDVHLKEKLIKGTNCLITMVLKNAQENRVEALV